jgi:hypothetical protein
MQNQNSFSVLKHPKSKQLFVEISKIKTAFS